MTPSEYKAKWNASTLKERSAAQENFIDLCHLVGHETPAKLDPEGKFFCFEKGAKKLGGGNGWADVWKRHFFAIEYKGKHKDLDAALIQLQRYALALEQPPLLIVTDMDKIIIHTNFTNSVHEVHTIYMNDIDQQDNLRKLYWMFNDPEKLRPRLTADAVTQEVAGKFAELAESLSGRGFKPEKVAHFINKVLFCMFAEDVGLLPDHLFTKMLEMSLDRPEEFESMAKDLFEAMKSGGRLFFKKIDWFNGGLFNDSDTIPMNRSDIEIALSASRFNWADIEPSIFGTLFERGLDPAKRSQLGAHYTDTKSINRIIQPIIYEPLVKEWTTTRNSIEKEMMGIEKLKKQATKERIRKAETEFQKFLTKLRDFRVLDPACGSGNFLYIALRTLKDIEHRANLDAEVLGLNRQMILSTSPDNVLGIEISPYAAELARVTIWIGEIQWMLKNGYDLNRNPVLRKLDQIECKDALVYKGKKTKWPKADVIIGNPPFIGGKKMKGKLGDDYVDNLRRIYKIDLPAFSDFVCFWFAIANNQLKNKVTNKVGFVSTNSIRHGTNRTVLDYAANHFKIYKAWSDEEWVNDGADVRVSIICYCNDFESDLLQTLNDNVVSGINSDLTPKSEIFETDIVKSKRLKNNEGVSFIGTQKSGSFDIDGELARKWLTMPNPNGKPNSDVVKIWTNGRAITGRDPDKWIIYFNPSLSEDDASLYEEPYLHIEKYVKNELLEKKKENESKNKSTKDIDAQLAKWWVHWRPRPEMQEAISTMSRCIVVPRVSKHLLFVWRPSATIVDSAAVAIAKDDDVTFGILHSKYHKLWSLRMCSWLGVGNDPRYTPTTTFETFPFPTGLTPNLSVLEYSNNHKDDIAIAAKRLNELRENWLNPPEWIKTQEEVVNGYPKRLLPVTDADMEKLKQRTLTNLYNVNPAWLQKAHEKLDIAVAKSYEWPIDISDDEAIHRLYLLNQERVGS